MLQHLKTLIITYNNMTKQLLSGLLLVSATTAFAQLPVSTTAEKKNVVLEEYTGKSCGYCPDGHKIAQDMQKAYPNDVFLINIHQGSYASGSPNYTTSFGNALAGQTGLTGYPSGTVNRHVFSGSATAMSRSKWSSSGSTIRSQDSYVNVALEATLNPTTRVLTVDVELYFTNNGASSVNLNVALLQNNILGPQSGGSTYNPTMMVGTQYKHMHMLRHLLTGQWGEAITTTTKGSKVTKTYTYTVPASYNSVKAELADLELVAFIAEGQQEIISGNDGPINILTSAADISNDISKMVNIFPNPAADLSTVAVTLTNGANVSMQVINALGEVIYERNAGSLPAGDHKMLVDLAGYAPGFYYAKLMIGEAVVTRQISVIR